MDDSLLVVPALATAWTISDDGLCYRFRLRSGVFFHNDPCFSKGIGRACVASDVVFSFSRLLDPSVSSPGSWIFKDRVAVDSPFVAINDTVFEMRLRQPFQPMLQILTMQYASIVPPEAVEMYGREFRSHPVGTGPFRFKIWAETEGLVLLKNDAYFEKDSAGAALPYLDAVRIHFMTDRKTAFMEFKKGDLDYFTGLESSYIQEALTPDGLLHPDLRDACYLLKNAYLNTEYLGIRMDSIGPLQNKKIRQALNFGFDRVAMLRTLRNGVGKPADAGFAPAGLPSYQPDLVKGYTYDPVKATRLLAEAGFPNGRNLPKITLLANADYVDLCTFIARQWQDLGIDAQVELTETAILRDRMRKGTAPFFRASWIADYPDAESFLTCFYGKNGAPPNYTQFNNAAFDALYETALQETNAVKRYALYREMDKILIEESPVIFLFYDEITQFVRKNIRGMSRNGINLLKLKRVRKI